jgi:hypothetical protein
LGQYRLSIYNRYPLNADLWLYSRVFSFGRRASRNRHLRRLSKGADYADQAQQAYSSVRSRGLEDDEELFGRDLDDEELFGREYDLLDERDISDDLD